MNYTDKWLRKKLIESRILIERNTYEPKAVKLLLNSGLYGDDENACREIVNDIKNSLPAFTNALDWTPKYLIGIVNMIIKYADGDRSKVDEFVRRKLDVIDECIRIIKTIRPKKSKQEQLELDDTFNNKFSIKDVENFVDAHIDEIEAKSQAKLKGMKFEESSNYE